MAERQVQRAADRRLSYPLHFAFAFLETQAIDTLEPRGAEIYMAVLYVDGRCRVLLLGYMNELRT